MVGDGDALLAGRADWPAIAAAMARAFRDDPFTAFAIPEPGARVATMEAIFAAQLEYAASRGSLVYTLPGAAGAAIWTPTDREPDAVIEDALAERMQTALGDRYAAVGEALHVITEQRPPAVWNLDWLGTDPGRQRTGCATTLLGAQLRVCDAAGHLASLWTATEENVRFYKGRGFAVTSEVQPPAAPRVWWMVREPRQ